MTRQMTGYIVSLDMSVINKIQVTELKSKLLEVIRKVEKGETFEITKGGKLVAHLKPIEDFSIPATGFAQIKILDEGTLDLSNDWTFDSENIKIK